MIAAVRHCRLTLFLAGGFVCLAGCSKSDTSRPSVSIPAIDVTGMEKQVAEALHAARNVVIDKPDSAEVWGVFGETCQAHGLDAQANSAYSRAQSLAPNDHRWVYLHAILAEKDGSGLEQAIGLFHRAIELAPKSPEIRFRLGNACMTAGRLDEAARAFQDALAIDPDLAAAHRSLGQVFLQTGDLAGALQHLEHADRLAPNDRLVKVALAQVFMKQGNRSRAEEAEAQARRSSIVIQLPDPVVFAMESLCVSSARCADRAASLMAAGDFESAVKPLTVLVEVHPEDPAVRARLGRCHAALRQFEQARTEYEAAIKLDPTVGPTHASLGSVLLNLRLPEEAAKHFQRAVEIDADRPEPRVQLATTLARLGRIRESLVEFEHAAKTEVAKGTLDARGEFEWGNALMQDRQFDIAIAHYQKSISLDPQNPDAYANLGLAFEHSGRVDDAIKQFEEVLRIKPDHPAGAHLAQLQKGKQS